MHDSQSLPARPDLDMEFFMHNAQETRLAGDDLEDCLNLWQEWSDLLRSRALRAGGRSYLALWLDEAVEKAVDAAWKSSPSRGFRLNALAQTLCMAAVHEMIPEVEEAGCAPLPHASKELARAAADAGLPCNAGAAEKPSPSLVFGRRYAVVTAYPFRGGCEICALQGSCPRSGGDESVIELPGFEQTSPPY